jgi:hypothetical protein
MWEGMELIPGRDCGDCTICCTWPTINQPEIQKVSGSTCKHCTAKGCGIYADRYPVCRRYYCAWRTVDIFGDDWRPDKSGVLPYVETEGISEDFDLSTGIGLMLVGHAGHIVRQKWFQDFVVTGVLSSVPLFLSLPGPRGHQAATVSLNTEEMVEAIRQGRIKDALEKALKILRGWKFVPATITHSGNDVST